MIDLPSELVAILSGPHTTAHLLTIDLDTPLNLTSSGAHLEYGGVEYRAGYWQAKASIKQQSSPKIGEINIDLDSVDSAITALFFASNWLNAPVTISKVWFNDSNQILFKTVIWRGLLNGKSGEESEKKATMKLKAASIWADFEAARGRKTNLKSQQVFYPNDNGFEFSGLVITDIPWGRKGTSSFSSGGGGAGGRGSRGSTQRQF
ncbi:DUF2163 domain-containing protein [Pseudoalteromonas sp. S1688]|uniref:DUF2163 domain-containing protein n=1 Tax=Pseudoalteromonas sp. S1688 TaxID=579511 RepID=UPI00110A8F79|nr:DUF2163 domain-containing protein [Pseudoalteromonas sp. S1688]TMP51482.1 hypothetical protein CWB81_06030 [Pseudoalteromonas sp. S1688]